MKTDYEKAREQAEETRRREEERRRNEPPAITITTSGHLSASIGGGLGIDLSSGELTMGIGGIGVSIDL